MTTEISQAKEDLRQKIRTQLERISPAVRAVESIELCNRLKPQMQSAHAILFFAPLADELDVWPLLEKFATTGKVCALPAYDPARDVYLARWVKDPAKEIVTGKFGVREPAAVCPEVPLDRFDLVLVPGLAFDRSGNRLGRGRGFYDRLLKAVSGVKCGIGYDSQLLENIPVAAHDARVNFVVTPGGCLRRKN